MAGHDSRLDEQRHDPDEIDPERIALEKFAAAVIPVWQYQARVDGGIDVRGEGEMAHRIIPRDGDVSRRSVQCDGKAAE